MGIERVRRIREENRTTKGDLTKKNKTVAKMLAKYCEGGPRRRSLISSFRTMKDVENMFAEIRATEEFTEGTTKELNRVEKIANMKYRNGGFGAVIQYFFDYYLNSAGLGVKGTRGRYKESNSTISSTEKRILNESKKLSIKNWREL